MSNVLPPYEAPFKPVPQVTPFTYRDGITMLKKVELIQRYINRVIVPFVNENMEELGDAFETQVQQLIAQVNEAIATEHAFVVESIGDLEGKSVEEALDELTQYIDNAVASIINSTIAVSDPVILAILQDETSDSYAELTSIIDGNIDTHNFAQLEATK